MQSNKMELCAGRAGGQVLDVLGIAGRAATLREIRSMTGRAMLDGPRDYQTHELEGPLLDLAVAKSIGLMAVIHRVDNAVSPFFECCVLDECGRLQYQFVPSRNWTQGGPLVEQHAISLVERGLGVWVADIRGSAITCANSPLLAAMRALVAARIGEVVRM